ncbi:MAG: hypothetical protein RIR11_3847 [Bacteroidota bacterium]|jgi:AcrR family transcriptional regulator
MLANQKEIWIKTGYEAFALLGQNGLKIEPLAKKVGISKSSFYHHFADTDIFLEYLLDYHIQQSYIMANNEKRAQNIDPELINVLLEHKTDLLFNRQLRILRADKQFNNILLKSNQITGDYFVMIWVKDISPKLNRQQLEGIFELALENFYLQITAENINYKWLSNYFSNLKKIISNFT